MMELIAAALLWLFVSVTGWEALDPMEMVPKSKLSGAKVIGATPVPVRDTVLPPLETSPLVRPSELGAKVTSNVHVAFAGSEVGQLLVRE